jgi:hypothetical protein
MTTTTNTPTSTTRDAIPTSPVRAGRLTDGLSFSPFFVDISQCHIKKESGMIVLGGNLTWTTYDATYSSSVIHFIWGWQPRNGGVLIPNFWAQDREELVTMRRQTMSAALQNEFPNGTPELDLFQVKVLGSVGSAMLPRMESIFFNASIPCGFEAVNSNAVPSWILPDVWGLRLENEVDPQLILGESRLKQYRAAQNEVRSLLSQSISSGAPPERFSRIERDMRTDNTITNKANSASTASFIVILLIALGTTAVIVFLLVLARRARKSRKKAGVSGEKAFPNTIPPNDAPSRPNRDFIPSMSSTGSTPNARMHSVSNDGYPHHYHDRPSMEYNHVPPRRSTSRDPTMPAHRSSLGQHSMTLSNGRQSMYYSAPNGVHKSRPVQNLPSYQEEVPVRSSLVSSIGHHDGWTPQQVSDMQTIAQHHTHRMTQSREPPASQAFQQSAGMETNGPSHPDPTRTSRDDFHGHQYHQSTSHFSNQQQAQPQVLYQIHPPSQLQHANYGRFPNHNAHQYGQPENRPFNHQEHHAEAPHQARVSSNFAHTAHQPGVLMHQKSDVSASSHDAHAGNQSVDSNCTLYNALGGSEEREDNQRLAPLQEEESGSVAIEASDEEIKLKQEQERQLIEQLSALLDHHEHERSKREQQRLEKTLSMQSSVSGAHGNQDPIRPAGPRDLQPAVLEDPHPELNVSCEDAPVRFDSMKRAQAPVEIAQEPKTSRVASTTSLGRAATMRSLRSPRRKVTSDILMNSMSQSRSSDFSWGISSMGHNVASMSTLPSSYILPEINVIPPSNSTPSVDYPPYEKTSNRTYEDSLRSIEYGDQSGNSKPKTLPRTSSRISSASHQVMHPGGDHEFRDQTVSVSLIALAQDSTMNLIDTDASSDDDNPAGFVSNSQGAPGHYRPRSSSLSAVLEVREDSSLRRPSHEDAEQRGSENRHVEGQPSKPKVSSGAMQFLQDTNPTYVNQYQVPSTDRDTILCDERVKVLEMQNRPDPSPHSTSTSPSSSVKNFDHFSAGNRIRKAEQSAREELLAMPQRKPNSSSVAKLSSSLLGRGDARAGGTCL